MFVNEQTCREVLENARRVLGKKRYSGMYEQSSQASSEWKSDKKRDVGKNTSKLFEIIKSKSIFKYFNGLHGVRNEDKNTFLEIVGRRYKNVDIEFMHAYIVSEMKEIDEDFERFIECINSILLQEIDHKETFTRKGNELISNECRYLKFLKTLRSTQSHLVDEGKLKSRKVALFNLNSIISLHEKIGNEMKGLSKLNKIYTPFRNNIHRFREEYVSFLTNQRHVMEYIMENRNAIKNPLYSTEKDINEVFMKPLHHFLSYRSFFACFKNTCHMADENCFSFLENSFIDIIGMANENIRKADGQGYVQDLQNKMDDYDKLSGCKLGDLMFNHVATFVFRKNKRSYVVLFFKKGFSIILQEDCDRLQFVESINYEDVLKLKTYKNGEIAQLKVVWGRDGVREMVVIPFTSLELVDRISNMMNERIRGKKQVAIEEKKEKGGAALIIHEKNIASRVEFGNIQLLVFMENNIDFDLCRRRIIARVGKHFYPERTISEEAIDLTHYSKFKFYFRDGDAMFPLEGDDDLNAAIVYSDGKLDIIIKRNEDM